MTWQVCSEFEAPHNLGSTPMQYRGTWYVRQYGPKGVGRTTLKWKGLGANQLQNPQNRPVIDAANAVLAYFSSNACTQAQIPAVSAFQTAYNASGQAGQLTVDGQYGGNTQAALQLTMQLAQSDAGGGPAESAPANCFGMAVPSTPGPDQTTTDSSGNTVIVNTGTDMTPWLIGGAVVLGAGALYYLYTHHKPRRRYA